MKWHLKTQTVPQNIAEVEQLLLTNLKVKDHKDFFAPLTPDQIKLSELGISKQQTTQAIELIKAHRNSSQPIIIFGDYDADGICATAILWRVLHDLGYNVKPFIPDREKHGYGITSSTLKEIFKQDKPSLVITVDNGIVAHEAIDFLQSQKIPVIITDHHTPEEKLPTADTVFATTKLCGASVAWLLAKELLLDEYDETKALELSTQQLDLCGLATIADQVPLTKFNRSFAKYGIEMLRQSKRPGLLALIKVAKINQSQINSSSINFGLAPRINAMGRLAHGLDALRLLCTPSSKQAQQLAQTLATTNDQRKDITYEQVEYAQSQVKKQLDDQQKILITYSENYHEGVIGLIAGRLMEKYYRPTIAISLDNKRGIAKASARSIQGVNIVELIRQVKDDLLTVGGHPMAAGFGLKISKLDQVIARLQSLAQDQIESEQLEKTLPVEMTLDLPLANEDLLAVIDKFRPFGQQNQEPIFGFKKVHVLDFMTMGKEGTHLRLTLTDGQQNYLKCVAWRQGYLAAQLKSGETVDLAGILELNEWNGRKNVQVRVKDIILK